MNKIFKNKYTNILMIFLPLLVALICVITMYARNNASEVAWLLPLEVKGEYSYDGENWYELTEESELSAFDGELIVRAQFTENIDKGLKLFFFCNHIGASFYINGELDYMDTQTEVGIMGIGLMDSMCGREWRHLTTSNVTSSDIVEIHLINYHSAGNKNAYREMLDNMYVVPDTGEMLQECMAQYQELKMVGVGIIVIAVMLLGAAVASIFIRSSMATRLMGYGLVSLFAGGFFIFDTVTVDNSVMLVALNNYGIMLCMMLFTYFLDVLIKDSLSGVRGRVANIVVVAEAAADSVLIILVITGNMLIYDGLPYWMVMQGIIVMILIACCIAEMIKNPKAIKMELIAFIVFLITMLIDFTGVADNMYSRGNCCKVVFLVLTILYLIRAVNSIILNHKVSVKARKLEKELTDMRITTMLSQIKPHFIYNTLGTIEQFCYDSPDKAADLVHKFSMYLRGNFTELDNKAPIRISKEMEHVKYYVSIEQIRFPDMQVIYDLKAEEFVVPALSVQPLVENAIKHGLMGLESGGKIIISTYETDENYCICVKDDGVGFDITQEFDSGKHVGIRNIRARVEAMCGGTLTIESTPGEGTTALIKIPKERK